MNTIDFVVKCSIAEHPNKRTVVELGQDECPHYDEIGKGLDFYSSKYESFCLIGGFNCEPKDSAM